MALAGALTTAGSARAAANGVTIMTIADLGARTPNTVWTSAVQAHVDAVNTTGGLRDARAVRHPLRLVVCDSSGADGAAQCARRAVQARVAAVVGLVTSDSRSVWGPLERARIPVIGTRVNGATDLASPMSFPLAPGLPGTLVALPQLAATAGAKRVAVLVSDYGTTTDAMLALLARGFAAGGTLSGPVVRVPRNATNLMPFATQVVQPGVDGVVAFVSGGSRGAVPDDLSRAGFKGWYATQAPFGDVALASDPTDRQTALVVGQFAPVDGDAAGMRQFRSEMDTSATGADLARTEGAVNGWLAAWVFERVAATVDSIDAHTIADAMAHLHAFDTGGITPPLTTDAPAPVLGRLFNPSVTLEQSLYGTTTRVAPGFVDPFVKGVT
jgi:ABC-type branched-subunit amino acid transport system substrate-binding protein